MWRPVGELERPAGLFSDNFNHGCLIGMGRHLQMHLPWVCLAVPPSGQSVAEGRAEWALLAEFQDPVGPSLSGQRSSVLPVPCFRTLGLIAVNQ